MRVVTWNIHSGVGTDRRYDPRRVLDVLGELDADVIGLQEVDWRHEPIDGKDQLHLLAEGLGMRAIAGPNLETHAGSYGNGLLTRLPITSIERIDLEHENREPRGAIDATVDAQGRVVRVLVTHLGLRRRERRAQMDTLMEHVRNGPDGADGAVLLGDLNEWLPTMWAGSPLRVDPAPVVATGRTWPTRAPALMLDRVLVWPASARVQHRVVRSRSARLASDHLPVAADIAWDGGRAPEKSA